ncbi:unnamed protein product [Leptidea sinapis]|uniref:Uncharacterized protein n=1 Tax=Leptidea sinapis TaxID=189913 RepID=A0A5E4Q849_9NEOP|nr:unnamed protein product [Leptidea sinapis]
MKGGLCTIYTSLLTISVLSSCALFIFVVSEALHTEDVDTKADLSGLGNVSKSPDTAKSDPQKPQYEMQQLPETSITQETMEDDKKMMFPDTLSVNSVTTDG